MGHIFVWALYGAREGRNLVWVSPGIGRAALFLKGRCGCLAVLREAAAVEVLSRRCRE